MRFCGTGRKLCGKICIKASDVCRKVRSARILEAYGDEKANTAKDSGFKTNPNAPSLRSSVDLTLKSMPVKKYNIGS